MKRYVLIILISVFTLSVSAALCHAQTDRTVTNTSKKGSLLVWPFIKASSADTIITLSNEYYKTVKVRCAYRTVFPCSHSAWVFTLQPNQPISWVASTGLGPDGKAIPRAAGSPPPLSAGHRAELRCWAVSNSETQQIAWNWLTGNAIIGDGTNQHWEYSAWRFAVNSSTTGVAAGAPGMIRLTGDSGNYDACPSGLQFSFLKQSPNTTGTFPSGTVDNRLTLVPCMQDLVHDTNKIVYTDLIRRTEDGSTRSGASVCVGCVASTSQWFEESLVSSKLHLAGGIDNPFTHSVTPAGGIVLHGKQKSLCPGSVGSPLLGVMSMQVYSDAGPVVGVTPTAVGPGQAYIQDASGNNTTTPISITW